MSETLIGTLSSGEETEVVLTPLEYTKILDIQQNIFELLTINHNEKEVLAKR